MTLRGAMAQAASYVVGLALLALVLGSVLSSCSQAEETSAPPAHEETLTPTYWHDLVHKSSCWYLVTIHGVGMDCIPDSQLQQ